jgi:hypothetical protein
MPKSSPFSKFVKWVGGIATPVIIAVLIYHFATPKPVPPPPPAPTPVTFEGMVINGAVNAPLQGAMVSFEISETAGGPYHDFTDEHGSYRIDFAGLKTPVRATLRAEANGFQPSRPVPLTAGNNDNRADFVLHPVPVAPHQESTPTPTPTVGSTHPPIYIRKLPVEAIKIHTLVNH